MTVRHLFKFGDFSLSVDERTLQRGDEKIALTPKMYELLLVFVRHPGRVLDKELLLQTVWPDSFVEEGNISFNIRQLRKALGDDAQSPSFIETIPRRGYRFVEKVEEFVVDDDAVESITDPLIPAKPKVRSRPFLWVGASAAALILVAIAAAWFFGYRTVRAAPILSSAFSIERLSTDGLVHLVAMSRDGKTIVYSRRNAGKQSLWVMQPGTSDNTQIVPLSDFLYYGLALSPDGKYLYYSRALPFTQQQTDVYRQSIYGGVPQRVITEAQGWISLSPDGKSISFVRCPYSEEEHCSLWIADSADGANERKLVSMPRPIRISDNKFSPDGKSIAFGVGESRTYASHFSLSAVDIDTGQVRQLTNEKFFNIEHIAWLPDGQGLLMTARQPPDKHFRIWQVSSAGEASPLTDDSQTYAALSLNDDGSGLVTTLVSPSFHLNLYQTSDSAINQKRLADALAVAFAPNGDLFFSSSRTGDQEIWSIRADGSGERQLTNNPADDIAPLVSPNNDLVYFESNRTGKVEIWKMKLDGSDQTQVTFGEGGNPVLASADGRWLYYKSALEKTYFRVSLMDGSEEKIFDRPSQDSVLAPTADRVALTERINGENVLEVVSLQGEPIKTFKYAEPQKDPVSLAWSHDAKFIAYVVATETGADGTLWFQPLDGGQPRKIADLHEEIFEPFSVALSPDDQAVAIIQGTWSHDAVLIKGLKTK